MKYKINMKEEYIEPYEIHMINNLEEHMTNNSEEHMIDDSKKNQIISQIHMNENS